MGINKKNIVENAIHTIRYRDLKPIYKEICYILIEKKYYRLMQCLFLLILLNKNDYIVNNSINPTMDENYKPLFTYCCKTGNLSGCRKIIEKHPDIVDHDNFNSIYTVALTNKNINIVIWLIKTFPTLMKTGDKYYYDVFYLACDVGDLDAVIWATNIIGSDNINMYDQYGYSIHSACRNGHLNIVTWLLKKNNYNLTYVIQPAFNIACENGHLDIAKLLVDKEILDPYDDDNYAFRMACANGHLNVAIWLTDTFPNINVHSDSEYAFRFACRNGHLNIVTWLLDNYPKIDIHVYEENAFRYAYKKGQLDIVKLLLTRFPDIDTNANDFMIYDDTIWKKINLIKYLLRNFPDRHHYFNTDDWYVSAEYRDKIKSVIVNYTRQLYEYPVSDLYERVKYICDVYLSSSPPLRYIPALFTML